MRRIAASTLNAGPAAQLEPQAYRHTAALGRVLSAGGLHCHRRWSRIRVV